MSRQSRLETKLTGLFHPTFLQVIDESRLHNVPKDAESHFKIIIASECFAGKTLVEQHRMVNQALQEELLQGLHAVSLKTLTPTQEIPEQFRSPQCKG